LTSRNLIKHGKFLYGFAASLNLKEFCPCKYDAFVGYESKEVDVYLKHLTPACCTKGSTPKTSSFQVGTVNLGAVYRIKDDTLGFEAENDFVKEAYKVGILGAHKFNSNFTAKAKLDNNLNLALAGKYKFSDLLSVALSGKFELKKGGGAVDFSKGLLAFPFGFEATLNIWARILWFLHLRNLNLILLCVGIW